MSGIARAPGRMRIKDLMPTASYSLILSLFPVAPKIITKVVVLGANSFCLWSETLYLIASLEYRR